MRVLINQECAAVAGGGQSECERNVELAGMATGAVVGAAAGAAAGGIGAAGGAIAGAGVGSLVANTVGPIFCSWFGDDSSDDDTDTDTESDADERPVGNPFRPDPVPTDDSFGASSSNMPLQYVVDTWEYNA